MTGLETLLEEHMILSPIIAFFAGMLTSITPCPLSGIPLIISYVSSATKETKKALLYSILFAIGTAITFSILGIIAISLGGTLRGGSSWWYIALGVLMVVLALQTWEVISIIPSTNLVGKNTKRGALGALLAGFLMGLFSSPCATPVLISLFAFVSASDSIPYGLMLIFFYSLGHGVLTVLAGTSITFLGKIRGSKASRYAKVVLGFLILLLGLYMFYLGF